MSAPTPTAAAANDRKASVALFYEHVWNRQDLARLERLFHPDFTFRGSLGSVRRGYAEFGTYVRLVTDALADYRCDVQEAVGEPDKVFAKVLFSGIHRADFLGYPPTGRRVSWIGAALFTFVDAKVADLWVLGDLDGLRRQLAEHAAAGAP